MIGEAKVGNLADVFVHKFKFNHQDFLIAYRLLSEKMAGAAGGGEFVQIDFFQVGSHENFYAELARYLRKE